MFSFSLFQIIILVSLSGLLAIVIRNFFKDRKWKFFLLKMIGIILLTWILNGFINLFNFSSMETKSAGDSALTTTLVVFCYVSMLLGMVAEYYYSQAKEGKKKFEMNYVEFVIPFLLSPMIFIPLLSIIHNPMDTVVTATPRLMIYLVSFQNGFLWKNYMSGQKKKVG